MKSVMKTISMITLVLLGAMQYGCAKMMETVTATQLTDPSQRSSDLNAINWLRVYHAKTGSVTTMIDGIRIIP